MNLVARQTPGLAVLLPLLVLRLVLLLAFRFGTFAGLGGSAAPDAGPRALISTNLWIVAVDLITLAVVAWLLRREGASLGGLIGRLRFADVGWGLVVGVALLATLLVGNFVGNLLMYAGPPPATGASGGLGVPPLWFGLWCVLLMPLTIAVAEEVLYRGYLQPRWAGRIGRIAGPVLVAVFFGLQHLAFVAGTPQAAFVRVLSTLLGGLLLAWLYVRFGRLWPLIVGHWLADVVGLGLPVLFLALQG